MTVPSAPLLVLDIVNFWGVHSATLPDTPRLALRDAIAGRDALATIITTMEALYASRGTAGSQGIALLESVAAFVATHNFYGRGERAGAIAGVAGRIAAGGEALVESDPVLDERFAEPELVLPGDMP